MSISVSFSASHPPGVPISLTEVSTLHLPWGDTLGGETVWCNAVDFRRGGGVGAGRANHWLVGAPPLRDGVTWGKSLHCFHL